MNADNLGFQDGSFDSVLCGFVGWDYCFDFALGKFTGPDPRVKEISRVLRDDGRVWISAWEKQDDLDWMEKIFVRHWPSILSDREFTEHRPIGYSRESAEGYDIILKSAGFKNIEILHEKADLVSTDEQEWWEQVRRLGWERYFKRIENEGPGKLPRFKEAVFEDLEHHKHMDGIHFTKSVLFASGTKQATLGPWHLSR